MRKPLKKLQKGAGWQPDEHVFLIENFHKMTNQQLTDHINKYRSSAGKLTVSGVRHECKNLGLTRGIQIRWSKKDVQRLRAWMPIMGNIEIARLLNEVGTSRRKIKGEWVYRKFTNKAIQKKYTLLKLSRTPEQIARIKADNLLINTPDAHAKMWQTRGKAKEEEIRITHGVRMIKIDGKFIPYTRWMYNKFICELQPEEIVFHIDLDSLNDDPENLEVRTRKTQRVSLNDRKRAIPLLQKRLAKIQKKYEWLISADEKRTAMKDILRIQRLIENQIQRLKKSSITKTKVPKTV